MTDLEGFRRWLIENSGYSHRVIGDIVSRFRRANKILDWYGDPIYLFYLEREDEYRSFSCSVRSQIKKAVNLYFDYDKTKDRA